MQPRRRMLLGFVLANSAIAAVAATLFLNRPLPPPQIQGVLLPESRELARFVLTDHRGDAFSNSDLEGRWHLVSYGFTSCPDVCPAKLASYVSFFDPSFTGVTATDGDEMGATAFASSLGILSTLEPAEGTTLEDGDYEVAHGVTLLLLNPEGELQAVFEPQRTDGSEFPGFDIKTLVRDYTAVRTHLD